VKARWPEARLDDIADELGIGRKTVRRALERHRAAERARAANAPRTPQPRPTARHPAQFDLVDTGEL
jgi:predicted ArsR family transcriptional regulator